MTVQSPYGSDRRGWQHSGLAVTAPLGYIYAMQTVVETPTFMRQADKLFSEDERRELIDFLAKNPLAGDKIQGTGGVRKLRASRPPDEASAAAHG